MSSDIVVTRLIWLSLFASVHSGSVYVAHFTDDVIGCDHFTNEYIDCSGLTLSETTTPDGYDACGLSGPMEMIKPVDDEHDVYIEIWKLLPCDKEMMWSTRMKLCESLKNTDTPWYCLVEAMNITGCPIQGGTYTLKDLLISLDFLKGVLTHEFCGAYRVVLQILKGTDPVVCYTCEVSIQEED